MERPEKIVDNRQSERDRSKSACLAAHQVTKKRIEDKFQEDVTEKDRAQSAASRKVTFMINDEVVQPDQFSNEKEDSMLLEDNVDDVLSSDDLLHDSDMDPEEIKR